MSYRPTISSAEHVFARLVRSSSQKTDQVSAPAHATPAATPAQGQGGIFQSVSNSLVNMAHSVAEAINPQPSSRYQLDLLHDPNSDDEFEAVEVPKHRRALAQPRVTLQPQILHQKQEFVQENRDEDEDMRLAIQASLQTAQTNGFESQPSTPEIKPLRHPDAMTGLVIDDGTAGHQNPDDIDYSNREMTIQFNMRQAYLKAGEPQHLRQQAFFVRSQPFRFARMDWTLKLFPRGHFKFVSQFQTQFMVFIEPVVPMQDRDSLKFTLRLIVLDSDEEDSNIFQEANLAFLRGSRNDQGFSTAFAEYFDLQRRSLISHNGMITFRVCLQIISEDPPRALPQFAEPFSLSNISAPLISPASHAPRDELGMIGIINLGATCYMNSMLQSLFHIAALRRAVYQLPLPDAKNDAKNIPHQLQLLFYRLQTHTAAVDTRALIASFGWTGNEVYQQHDVQEFARVLLDHLDVSMSKVKSENNFDASPSFIKYLFEGKSQTYIDCPAVRYSSVRDESFFDISLDVQGAGPTLMDSLRRYIAIETLNGDNQYRTPSNGLQDAVRGTRFLQFPRVLQLQLKRFAYDPNLDAMSKVNDRFEFPIELDLSTFLHRPAAQFPSLSLKAETDLECQYLLHSVLVHSGSATGGHYYVFVRPDPLNQPSVWYRLDDDRVARCPTQEAVNDNFGGPPDQQQSIFSTLSSYFVKPEYANRQHSAYMLTYIRASDAPQLLKPVLNTDIPSALLDAMSLQQLASEAAAAELRYDQIRVNLQLLIEPELVAKFGIELHKTSVGSKRKVSELLSSEDKFYSFNQLATDRLSVEETMTVGQLREKLATRMSVPAAEVGLFLFSADVPGRVKSLSEYLNFQIGCKQFNIQDLDSTITSIAGTSEPKLYVCRQRSNSSEFMPLCYFDVRLQKLHFIGTYWPTNGAWSISADEIQQTVVKLLGSKIKGSMDISVQSMQGLRHFGLFERDIAAPRSFSTVYVADQLSEADVISSHQTLRGHFHTCLTSPLKKTQDFEGIEPFCDEAQLKLAHFFPSLRAFIDDQTHIVELVLEQRSRQSGLDKVLRAVVHEHLHLSVLISALALHMQVQAECVRLFEMDSVDDTKYCLDKYHTYASSAKVSDCFGDFVVRRRLVFEVLSHSVDMLNTHAQCQLLWLDPKTMRHTTVSPLCRLDGTVDDVIAAAKLELIRSGSLAAADVQLSATFLNADPRPISGDILSDSIWHWVKGRADMNVRVLLQIADEVIPDSIYMWCSFEHSVMDSIQFTVAIRPSETWAAFRTRLALRLGRDLKRTKGSGRYQMSGFQYSSQKQFKDDDIIFDPLGNDQVKAITISEPVQSSYSNGGGIRFT